MNKILVLVILLSLVAIVIGYSTIFNEENSALCIDGGFSISTIAGLILLLKNGTFIKNKLFKISISIFIIEILFKIMHFPFAGPMIILSFLSISILYTIHFFKKQNKVMVDYLKLIILYIAVFEWVFSLLHWPYAWEIQYMSGFIFLIFIMYYIISEKRNGRLILN